MRFPRRWRVEDRKMLFDCRVFSVTGVTSERVGDARRETFYRVVAPDWVNVVAFTAARELVMVRQFRHGAERMTLEIPGGMVDAGESPKVAASRELLEETGYAPGRLDSIGRCNPNPALFGNTLHTFVAWDCARVEDVIPVGDEETMVELIPWDELASKIRGGEIEHALVLAAFALLAARRE